MDLIVKVCRALASRVRLAMLLHVYSSPGLVVEQIAKRVGVPDFTASKHLKVLSDCRLVQSAASGRYVQYSAPPPGSTTHPFLSGLQPLVRQALTSRDTNCTPAQVCNLFGGQVCTWEQVFAAMIGHVTAYTHLRRLLILQELLRKGPLELETLAQAIQMSPDAARRHLRKLTRRGLIALAREGQYRWILTPTEGSPFQQALLQLVLRSLGDRRPRED